MILDKYKISMFDEHGPGNVSDRANVYLTCEKWPHGYLYDKKTAIFQVSYSVRLVVKLVSRLCNTKMRPDFY